MVPEPLQCDLGLICDRLQGRGSALHERGLELQPCGAEGFHDLAQPGLRLLRIPSGVIGLHETASGGLVLVGCIAIEREQRIGDQLLSLLLGAAL